MIDYIKYYPDSHHIKRSDLYKSQMSTYCIENQGQWFSVPYTASLSLYIYLAMLCEVAIWGGRRGDPSTVVVAVVFVKTNVKGTQAYTLYICDEYTIHGIYWVSIF